MCDIQDGLGKPSLWDSTTSPRAILSVEKASHSIKSVGQAKYILRDVSFTVNSGNVLAIMGPSGAGKTTLMNFLTLERVPGVRDGTVKLNNEQLNIHRFVKYGSLVTQQDHHWTFLTCYETLAFASELSIPDRGQRDVEIKSLLQRLGLEKCQNTRAGNQFVPGLSGGERRRLSIAVGLIKNPVLFFLDEPTSGLDAAAALGIITFLHKLAHSSDVVVVCTVHQPSARILSCFDMLLLLSGGRVGYCGQTSCAASYFESIGHSFPLHENPADFMLDLVNYDFGDHDLVEKVLGAWSDRDALKQTDKHPHGLGMPDLPAYKRSVAAEIRVLLRRQCLLTLRDPLLYIGRMLAFLVACSFFALVYIRSRDHSQDQALNKFWLSTVWFVAVPSNLAVSTCFSVNLEFCNVAKETKNGMYGLSSHMLAHALLQVPLVILLSLSAVMLPGYALANMNLPMSLQYIMAHAAFLFCFENVAQLFALAHASPLIGMMAFICFWFANFLFAGFLVPLDDVVVPLRFFGFAFPMRYSMRSLTYIEFHDLIFEGATPDASIPSGFRCTGGAQQKHCYGRTGLQVLNSMSTIFDNISAQDTVAVDLAIVISIACFAKLLFVIAASWKTRGAIPPSQNHVQRKEIMESNQLSKSEQINVQNAAEDTWTAPNEWKVSL